jgi:hypothetical protein
MLSFSKTSLSLSCYIYIDKIIFYLWLYKILTSLSEPTYTSSCFCFYSVQLPWQRPKQLLSFVEEFSRIKDVFKLYLNLAKHNWNVNFENYSVFLCNNKTCLSAFYSQSVCGKSILCLPNKWLGHLLVFLAEAPFTLRSIFGTVPLFWFLDYI